MSADPVLGTLAYPCQMCGAEAGVDCLDDCPSLEQTELDIDVTGTPPLAELARAVYTLPFGRLAGEPPYRQDGSDDEFVAELADWMQRYADILRVEVDLMQAQCRKQIGQQIQLDVLRSVFAPEGNDESG